ncbi:NUDIX hydrolase [Planosporangium sp. 12N6]|uniref:NUDIX hydrolase n=1 Tax=Planosporangium spinosum TaxID=3402278 RepID=UPI003CEA89DA
MTRPDAISRRAARVLLVDASGRVLMLHGRDPARPDHGYWFTVGGGLDEGESPVQGAVRELFEETGLRVSAETVGAPVFHEVIEFPFDGAWYRQEQDFFLLRVDSWEVDFTGHTEIERASVDAYRWWPVDELRATGEQIYPPTLPDLLATLAPDLLATLAPDLLMPLTVEDGPC